MSHVIANFTEADFLTVEASRRGLVRIYQDSGSMAFMHTMNITQARQLAAALISTASEAEEIAEANAKMEATA